MASLDAKTKLKKRKGKHGERERERERAVMAKKEPGGWRRSANEKRARGRKEGEG